MWPSWAFTQVTLRALEVSCETLRICHGAGGIGDEPAPAAEEQAAVIPELGHEQAPVGEADVVAGRYEHRLVHVVGVFGDHRRRPDPDAVQGGVQPVVGAVDDRLAAQGARPRGDAVCVVFTDAQDQAVQGAARLGVFQRGLHGGTGS